MLEQHRSINRPSLATRRRVSIAAPWLLALAVMALEPGHAQAQDAKTIIESVLEARAERLAGVHDYTIFLTLNGTGETTLYHERVESVEGPTFRTVPPHEYQGVGVKKAGLANAPGAGGGMPGAGGGVPGAGGGLPGAGGGLPGGLPGAAAADAGLGAGGEGSLLERAGSTAVGAATGSLQQQLMQKGMGGMQSMMGDLTTQSVDAAAADAERMTRLLNEMAISGRLEGSEVIGGAECHIVRSDEIDGAASLTQIGEASFTPHSVSLCIDAAEYVVRRATLEGEVAIDGQPRNIRLEMLSKDFRRVESMYLPFRRVTRISGMKGAMEESDPEKMQQMREDMAEAQAKMKKLDEMLAKMPPAQRRMVEAQMGRARQQLEQFAGASDVLEAVIEVKEVRVNAGPPSLYGEGSMASSGGVELEIPYMIVVALPSQDGAGPNIALSGAIKGPEGDVMATVSLELPGNLPSAGRTAVNASASVQWATDRRKASFEAPEGRAHVTISYRDERKIVGEFSFEGVETHPADEAHPLQVVVHGHFETRIRGLVLMLSP